MISHRTIQAAVVTAFMLIGPLARAVTVGQVDSFEDGTTAGWGAGAPHPAPPQNQADGGPGGAGDNYLRLTATGGTGAGSRLVAFNLVQWAGDYLAAGGGAISLDVNNFGAADLSLRLLFSGPVGGATVHTAVTSVAIAVPSGSGWLPIEFAIDGASLTALQGNVDDLLGDVVEVRLMHNPLPNSSPPAQVAALGVDNILLKAGGVPEEATPWGGVKALYR